MGKNITIKVTNQDGDLEDLEFSERYVMFAQKYIEKFNGKEAAIYAGYSANSAESKASQLLRNVKVQLLVNHYRQELYRRNRVTIDELISELTNKVRVDASDLYDDDGNLLAISEMKPEVRRCIEEIEKTTTDYKGRSITKVKVKLSSRDNALDKLMRHLGGYEADQTIVGKPINLTINYDPKQLENDKVQ